MMTALIVALLFEHYQISSQFEAGHLGDSALGREGPTDSSQKSNKEKNIKITLKLIKISLSHKCQIAIVTSFSLPMFFYDLLRYYFGNILYGNQAKVSNRHNLHNPLWSFYILPVIQLTLYILNSISKRVVDTQSHVGVNLIQHFFFEPPFFRQSAVVAMALQLRVEVGFQIGYSFANLFLKSMIACQCWSGGANDFSQSVESMVPRTQQESNPQPLDQRSTTVQQSLQQGTSKDKSFRC